ncbi:MAG: ribonuclease HII [Bdellovibrionales bacterium]|nr:ribonuclease HII [Bdellovibrionales bacterium]
MGTAAMKSKKKKLTFDPYPWRNLKPYPVVGVDEVGRGCLAGSVYAAAVILSDEFVIEGLTDSKKLTAKRREELSELIHQHCRVSIAFATVEEIDRFNILRASLLAMKRAVEALNLDQAHILVDGNQRIPGLTFEQTTLVKGDLRAEPVAAASIVAKVFRDNEMVELGQEFPGYGLEDHKGYATKVHKDAIEKLGPAPFHRTSFAGVREFVRR